MTEQKTIPNSKINNNVIVTANEITKLIVSKEMAAKDAMTVLISSAGAVVLEIVNKMPTNDVLKYSKRTNELKLSIYKAFEGQLSGSVDSVAVIDALLSTIRDVLISTP